MPNAEPSAPRAARLALAFLGLLCACQSSPSRPADPKLDVRPFPALPAENVVGPIAVEARFYVDNKRTFGAELPREARVLPIAVKLGLRPGASDSVRFDPREAAPRLYLPDGTVVATKPFETVLTPYKLVNNAIASTALDARVLPPWSAATEAHLYFELGAAGELFVKRGEVSRRVGEEVRTFSLDRVLLGFDVEVDGVRRTVYVGIALASGAKQR